MWVTRLLHLPSVNDLGGKDLRVHEIPKLALQLDNPVVV
jgi:hypothetical protein